jgi:hypothetical protein
VRSVIGVPAMTDPLFLHPHPLTTQAELNLLPRPEPISPEDRASLLRVLREPLTREAATLVLTMSAADLAADVFGAGLCGI